MMKKRVVGDNQGQRGRLLLIRKRRATHGVAQRPAEGPGVARNMCNSRSGKQWCAGGAGP